METITVKGEAEGGLVSVFVNGNRRVTEININQKLNTGTEITRDGATSNNLTANVSGTMLLYNGYRVVATKKRLEILQQQSEQSVATAYTKGMTLVMCHVPSITQSTYKEKKLTLPLIYTLNNIDSSTRRKIIYIVKVFGYK